MSMPPPPRTPSDEWARVIRKAQSEVEARPRRVTTELDRLKASAQWKALPITIGMAIAAFSAIAFGAGVIERYYSSLDTRIERMIGAHAKTAEPHPHMSAQYRAELAEINAQLGRLAEQLDRIAEQTTRARRR